MVLYEGQRLSHALQRSVAAMVTCCVQKQMQDAMSVGVDLPASGTGFVQQQASSGQFFFLSGSWWYKYTG